MLGVGSTCNPTLSSLGTSFGLQPLLGTSLAVVSDMRIGRSDHSVTIERLLSISGEDQLTVDRKYLSPVTVRLGTRLMLISNDLPQLIDSSGAMASRMVIVQMLRSFLGREDRGLSYRLLGELPGILHWAIRVWQSLSLCGQFTEPKSSRELSLQMKDLGSPISQFVRDECSTGSDHKCDT